MEGLGLGVPGARESWGCTGGGVRFGGSGGGGVSVSARAGGGDSVSVGGGVGIGPRLGSMWSGMPTMAKTRSMKKTRT